MSLFMCALLGLVVCQGAILATTVYLHRCLAHRAVTLHPGAAFAFRFYLWITTGLRARDWAAIHRKHHRFTDVEGDPHSPILLGFWKIQLANAVLYRNEAKNPDLLSKYAPELKPDRWDRWFFDHAFIGLPIGIGAAYLITGSAWGALVLSVTHLASYILLSGAINAVGHTIGYKRFDGTSARNMRLLALITAGEGLHNNHHGRQASAMFTAGKSEVDPAWPVLRLLEATRLAKLRRPKPEHWRARRIPRRLWEPAAAAGG
jgi:stearoyl-CoA desaturase (delta-9 desaturase)